MLVFEAFFRTALKGGVDASRREGDLVLCLLSAIRLCTWTVSRAWRQLAVFNHAFDIISKGILGYNLLPLKAKQKLNQIDMKNSLQSNLT